MNSRLTKFESDVLGALLDGDNDVLKTLKLQIEQAEIERESTGAGFYLNFNVDRECPRVFPNKFRISDVTAEIAGLKYGAGFVLFVNDGAVSQLEGYSYEEPWPDTIKTYKFKQMNEPRNLPFESNDDRIR